MHDTAPTRLARGRTTGRLVGWALAIELALLWVVVFAPGALLWLLAAAATVAGLVVVASACSARPRRRTETLER